MPASARIRCAVAFRLAYNAHTLAITMEPRPEPVVAIRNVVASFDLGRTVNCAVIAQALSGRYDHAVFPAVVSNCAESRTSSQLFATGKVVIVGCASQDHGLYAAHLLVHTLQRVLGLDCAVLHYDICNMVCQVDMRYPVDLDALYQTADDWPLTVLANKKGEGGAAYEPDRFPGMAWGTKWPVPGAPSGTHLPIVTAMFATGKGVATGLKYIDQVDWIRAYLADHLAPFQAAAAHAKGKGKRAAGAGMSKSKKKRQKAAAELLDLQSLQL